MGRIFADGPEIVNRGHHGSGYLISLRWEWWDEIPDQVVDEYGEIREDLLPTAREWKLIFLHIDDLQKLMEEDSMVVHLHTHQWLLEGGGADQSWTHLLSNRINRVPFNVAHTALITMLHDMLFELECNNKDSGKWDWKSYARIFADRLSATVEEWFKPQPKMPPMGSTCMSSDDANTAITRMVNDRLGSFTTRHEATGGTYGWRLHLLHFANELSSFAKDLCEEEND